MKGQKSEKSANLTSVVFCFFPVRLPRPHIFFKTLQHSWLNTERIIVPKKIRQKKQTKLEKLS